MRYDSNASQQVGVPVDMEEDTVDSGGTGQSPIAPVPIDDEVANVTQSATVNEEAKTAGVMPQLLFNQLAHFSSLFLFLIFQLNASYLLTTERSLALMTILRRWRCLIDIGHRPEQNKCSKFLEVMDE